MADLKYNYSTMNSGKTLELLRKAYSFEELGFKIIIIKPEIDTKADNEITTRVGLSRKVDVVLKKDDKLLDRIKNNLINISCILVDEAQFLEPSQIDELNIISKFFDIEVICYGLRDNFKMQLFPGSKRLFEVADLLFSSDSRCVCGKDARFVSRKIENEYVDDGDEVIIDGSTDKITYEPMCGYCYLTKVKKLTKEKIMSNY